MGAVPGLVRVPGWEQHPWLRAAFSTRSGGATGAYGQPGEQNLGWTAEDDPGVVAKNRRRFLSAATEITSAALVTIRQIHGAVIQTVPPCSDTPLSTPEGRAVLEGDGLMTQASGFFLGIQTADCVPVLLADTRTRAVAAFHAGWRGTLARIVEHGVARMLQEFGSRPEELIAAIGPAIRPCCFAVGEEVRSAFTAEFAYAAELFFERPHMRMDLHEANRRQLLDAGVGDAAIQTIAECTACARLMNGRRKYFSHRAERGLTGRMLSVIGTVERSSGVLQ
jgi:YfiH family protein